MPSLKELSSLGLSMEPDPSKLCLRGRTSGYRAGVAGQAAQLVVSLLSAPPFRMPAPPCAWRGTEGPVHSPCHTEVSCRTGCFCSVCRCTQTPQPWGCHCE